VIQWYCVCFYHGDSGHQQVVKCLIDVRRLFIETGDQRYILNDLYVDDYCAWTQHIRSNLNWNFACISQMCSYKGRVLGIAARCLHQAKKCFTILEVAAVWHELMMLQPIVWPSILCAWVCVACSFAAQDQ